MLLIIISTILLTIVFRTLIEGQKNHRCRIDRPALVIITMVVAGRFHNYHSSSSSDDTTFIDAVLVPTTAYSVYHHSSSSSSSSSQRIMQQLVAEQYLIVGFWSQRILGIIVVLSSIFMFALAWKRRDRLFHRLVLGMSIYLLIWNGFMIYGAAAIPVGSTNAIGNFGSILTCTIQGFALYITILVALSYYCSFSVYSFVGVLHNFEKEKYIWTEKYIHISVHIYPIASGIYLLTQKAYNNTGAGYCFIKSDPLGCGTKEYPDVVCDRGPETERQLSKLILFWTIPLSLMLICPLTIMIILIVKVKNNQNRIRITATTVIVQTIIYLLALYGGIVPSIILHALSWSQLQQEETQIIMDIASNISYTLFGLWCMLVHRYFSIDSKKKRKKRNEKKKKKAAAGAATTNANTTTTTTTGNRDHTNTTTQCKIESEIFAVDDAVITNNNIFSSEEFDINDNDNDNDSENDNKENNNYNNDIGIQQQQQQGLDNNVIIQDSRIPAAIVEQDCNSGGSSSGNNKWSFNIFDGTNASGAFADFVHDGDSEDERVDNQQTIQWNAVQDHV